MDDMFGPVIDIYIENNSDDNIRVSFEELNINGFMLYNYFSAEVTAGKKANEELSLSEDEMEMSGIENIADIEMKVEIRDPDSYDLLIDPVLTSIKTSIADGYEQLLPSGGDVVLEQDGVKSHT